MPTSEQLEQYQKDMGAALEEFARLKRMVAFNRSAWETSIIQGNGMAETTLRDVAHTLLDQTMDCQTHALQLAKKFESL